MPSERAIVTREALFDLVWQSPLRDVARQLHLAPASLKRVCLRLRVPVPGIAYWRKKWQGQVGERPPLPPVAKGEQTEVLLRRRGAADPPRAASPADLQAATESPRPRVVVPDQLGELHPVLQETMPTILATADRLTGDPRRSVKSLPAVGVTKTSLDRALRLMNAVLFAVAAAGRDVRARPPRADRSTEPSTTGAWVDGQFVELLIYEHYDMVPLPPLPKRRKETADEALDRMFRKKVEYRSNGRLTIQVGGRGDGSPKWTDRGRLRLEDQLHEVVDQVIRYVDTAPARAAERQHLEEEARQVERRRGEARLAQIHEAARFDDLSRRAEAWSRARAMLAFVDAVERDARSREQATGNGESVAEWIAWARQKAREVEARCVSVGGPF